MLRFGQVGDSGLPVALRKGFFFASWEFDSLRFQCFDAFALYVVFCKAAW
jgi:hypothetical protein